MLQHPTQHPMTEQEISDTGCETHQFSMYNNKALHGEFLSLREARLGLFQECIKYGRIPTGFCWYQGTEEGIDGIHQFYHPIIHLPGGGVSRIPEANIFLISLKYTLPDLS